MIKKIDIPYSFSSNEISLIKREYISYHDWEKEVFNDVKAKVIKHLRIEQNNRCCYCGKELGFDIKDVDIEHIIPKSKYPKFCFEPKNLALCCPACNTKKSHKDIVIKEIKRYPKTGANISIIHAHYDNYADHIDILEECLYVPKSSKGCETIKVCELFRLHEVENKRKDFYSKNNPIMGLVMDFINSERQSNKSKLLKEQIINILSNC